MYFFITILHILISLLLIGIVLFQADEGAGLGGAFGTSAGGTGGSNVFGKKGASGVMTRFTAGLVTLFMITSFMLTYMVSRDMVETKRSSSRGVVQQPVGN